MTLAKYNQKRSFHETPEPTGGKATDRALRFVIQKHDASHLHYDFRLEMDGVLKSWAVPKGPSLNPSVKRLAMMVEDHPYDYRTFEGIIPEGNYGAGTVIVWDEGYYEPIESIKGKKAQEKELIKELKTGSLKIRLHGKKLKGEFALVKTKGMAENAWLLIKHNDLYATEADITLKDKSVISKKTIAQVAKEKKEGPSVAGTKKMIGPPPKKSSEDTDIRKKHLSVKGARRKTFYTSAKPMLATLVEKSFEGPGWIYEIKWDGYRSLAFLNKEDVTLKSRNNVSFAKKFYPIYEALKNWHVNAIVDGEIVALNSKGLPDFEALQNWKGPEDGALVYYLFDILWMDGKDLTTLTLDKRRSILKSLMRDDNKGGAIQYSDDFKTTANELLQQVKKKGLEGIMAKKADSIYKTDYRSKEWLKIKENRHQEMIITGFTKNVNTGKPFSSLLLGAFQENRLIYTGKVGTGFSIQKQEELLKKMKPLITGKIPFEEKPITKGHPNFYNRSTVASTTWLKPELIAEVAFTEMTKDGVMRHPSFIGLREDKGTQEVVLEKSIPVTEALRHTDKENKTGKTAAGEEIIPNSEEGEITKKVNHHALVFKNLNKIFWPKEKITKRDLINYYYKIGHYILPYLKDRPQSLNRFPNGIRDHGFYQKDVKGKVPAWADTFPYQSEGDTREKDFLLCNNEATLLYMANLGCIEMNPWNSTIKKPDHPTWCVIDLDPGNNSFGGVIQAAQVTHRVLEALKVDHYPKTSGSTGMHIYIPLNARYTYGQSKEFARVIVSIVQKELPGFTTIERVVKARKGKMYLDFLQNRDQATLAAPYSCRPKPGATVSMPLHWDEIKPGLQMQDFHIFNAAERIQQTGDIFKPVLGKGIDMKKALDNAGTLYDGL